MWIKGLYTTSLRVIPIGRFINDGEVESNFVREIASDFSLGHYASLIRLSQQWLARFKRAVTTLKQ